MNACFAFSQPDQFREAHLLAMAPAASDRAPTIGETFMFEYLSVVTQRKSRERGRESYVENDE